MLAAHAQATKDHAVQLTATTQLTPPAIRLKWRTIPYGTPVYYVFKKAVTATSWGSAIGTITTGDTTYTDNAVIADSAYEYSVTASGTGISPSPAGYIYAGIRAPAIHSRGTLVLLVDTTFTDSCAAELTTLMQDLNGDGWQLVRHDVGRSVPDTVVKAMIRQHYTDMPDVRAALIVGHIAVPYSGNLNPDGHPDHLGAWPADVFYGSMAGIWNDVSVNNATAASPVNHNIPGDGKWDDVLIPTGGVQLQVSRIDMWNMPAFAATEVQMMRRYLRRAHIYKMDSLPMRKRALIDDNFGAFSGEAFAANGWRIFAPMVGYDSMVTIPFIASLAAGPYQWAYACGPGSYTSAGGVGTTADIATSGTVNGIFTAVFGSYLGDWNTANNFMRAPLCATVPALTSCWAGRPNWFMHHMALGQNIGYALRLTQNNMTPSIMYQPTGVGAGWIHEALMGDLSLRTDYIKPVPDVTATAVPLYGATVTWAASPDAAVLGYYVYRADSLWGHYARISPMVSGLSFIDTVGVNGLKYYMVRPIKLQATASGSYYNLGLGVTDTAIVTYPVPPTGIAAVGTKLTAEVYPDPAYTSLNVAIATDVEGMADMCMVGMSGRRYLPATRMLRVGENIYSVDVSGLPAGTYIVQVRTANGVYINKVWVKL
ncbi:hypothetical protein GCM10023093_04570 [Nemorincola caseinilytica]|uniref:T9SS C-terminal target domain-containing protein n=1 Tax=Nemorincola caseinilytica TaxID=2054315 RepID=A0ABP8N6Z2_9BACT